MLILSRKPNERIRIGKDVFLTVVEIRPGRVRLGLEAPKEVEIVREEIDRKEGETCSTSSST